MTSMGLRSESTGKNNKKLENMSSYCSDDTGAFLKIKNMEGINIEGKTGVQLVRSINMFSSWVLSQSNAVLYEQKKLCYIPYAISKSIACVMLERRNYV